MSDETPQDPYAVPTPGAVPPPTPAYPAPPPAGYPAPTYPAAGYPGGHAPKPGAGGFAITALIASIIALMICWVPFIGAIAALIALGISIGAWVSAKKSGRPAGLAVAGTIISALALLAAAVISVAFLILIDQGREASRYCNSVSSTQAEYDQCIEDRVSSWFGVDTNS